MLSVMKNIIILILLTSITAFSQKHKRDSIWAPINYFIGSWKGEGEGQSGQGKYERTYQLILNNNFVEIKNKTIYAPTTQNPKGEVHEDLGFFLYDKGRKTFLLRQLHIESFANDYVLETISADKKTLAFISESIINIPKGWRAKETYRLISDNEFEETFELAEPGKEFTVYSKARFTRL